MNRAAWALATLVACGVSQERPDAIDSGEVPTDTDAAPCADGGAPTTWYRDDDGDGLGLDDDRVEACDLPEGYADAGGDCDDQDPTRFPGAPPICADGIVNDCVATDEAVCRYGGWYELGVVGPAVVGTEHRGHLASGLAVIGDVDGNGTDDLVVGARNASPTERSAGMAYLITDPFAGDVDMASAARFIGTTQAEHVGARAAPGGDLDGDGAPDLAVQADGTSDVLLFSGALRGDHVATEAAFARLPGAPYVEGFVGGVDWTGDGRDDLAASTIYATDDQSGAVWIFAGPLAGKPEPWAVISGTSEKQQLGRRLARVTDTDGDGLDELATQAMPVPYLHSGGGEVYLLTEHPPGTTVVADVATAHLYGLYHEYIGETVGSGDIDGDGYGDLLLSAVAWHMDGADQDVAARLIPGPISGEHMAGDVAVLTVEDRAGCCNVVEIPGDVDGDGFDDLLVAGPSDPHPSLGGRSGAIHLIYGGPHLTGTLAVDRDPSLTESDAVFYGVPGDVAGEILTGGDFDGDGFSDFAISAIDHSTAEPGVGALYIVFGQAW